MRASGYPAAPSFLLVRVAHSAPWQGHSGWLLLTVWSFVGFVGFVGGLTVHGAGLRVWERGAPKGRTRAPIYRGGLIGLLHVERDRTRDAAIGSPELHKGDLYHHVPLPSSAAALSGGCCQCTVIKCEGLFTKVSVSPGNTKLYYTDSPFTAPIHTCVT